MKSPMLIPVPFSLQGPRVEVRAYRPGDAAAFYEAVDESRDHLPPFEGWATGYTMDHATIHVNRSRARWILREEFAAGIFHRETGRFLGASGIHMCDWYRRLFIIGYWIRKSEQGNGYITEAVQLLTRMAFKDLGANRVEIRMSTLNHRSRRVPERLGYQLEAVCRNEAFPIDGQVGDALLFAMIPADFAAQEWARALDQAGTVTAKGEDL